MNFTSATFVAYARATASTYVNNVVYNWGNKRAHGNPRGDNFVGNMLKKGT